VVWGSSDHAIEAGLAQLRWLPAADAIPAAARSIRASSGVSFSMEYQEESINHHFRAARDDFSLDEVVAAFASCREGSEDWWQNKDWQAILW
jgi:hypothetical protein